MFIYHTLVDVERIMSLMTHLSKAI